MLYAIVTWRTHVMLLAMRLYFEARACYAACQKRYAALPRAYEVAARVRVDMKRQRYSGAA